MMCTPPACYIWFDWLVVDGMASDGQVAGHVHLAADYMVFDQLGYMVLDWLVVDYMVLDWLVVDCMKAYSQVDDMIAGYKSLTVAWDNLVLIASVVEDQQRRTYHESNDQV